MNRFTFLLGTLSAVLLAGCGEGGTAPPPADEHSIRTFVGHVAEYQPDPRRFADCLAEGSNVDDTLRNKLKGMMARLDHATVDEGGASATAYVILEVLQTGEQLGPVEWKLEKSGDEWKLKMLAIPDAPSPNVN